MRLKKNKDSKKKLLIDYGVRKVNSYAAKTEERNWLFEENHSRFTDRRVLKIKIGNSLSNLITLTPAGQRYNQFL